MAQDVEVGLTNGRTLIVENTTEDEVLKKVAQADSLGSIYINARDGAYRVLPGHVVYVRYAPEGVAAILPTALTES